MNWTDIELIAEELEEEHGDVDPLTVKFTVLRDLVEGLEEFEAEPGQSVNEQILEAIQAGWIEEREANVAANDGRSASGRSRGNTSGLGGGSDDDEEDSKESSYSPNNPFR